MNIGLTKELLTNFFWNIEYNAGASIAQTVRSNIASHTPSNDTVRTDDKLTPKMEILVRKASDRRQFQKEHALQLTGDKMLQQQASLFTKKVAVGNARSLSWWDEIDDDDDVINLLHVEGPITRNGGACSYGSKDIRDQMLYVANMQNCIGHILLIDSPGGNAFSSNDFEQATDAAKNAKQPTLGLIDGSCFSAAFDLSAMLDEVYFTHPKDGIGCIGTYFCTFTNKNGDQNTITQEVFREIYAEVSSDKNLAFRKLAEGDETLVKEWVGKFANEFRERVKARRPNTPEDWLKGKDLEASETVGIWTQGQSDLNGCIQRILDLQQR